MALDIDAEMNRYAETVRHLWNTCFAPVQPSPLACSPWDEFGEIDRLLFKVIVADPHEVALPTDHLAFGQIPIESIRFTHRRESAKAQLLTRHPVHKTWEPYEVRSVAPGDVVGDFIALFDWDLYGQNRPFALVNGRLQQCRQAPELIGRHVLIHHWETTFFRSAEQSPK